MEDNLTDFLVDFHDNIASEAHASEQLREHVFIENIGEILAEYGEVDDCIKSCFKSHGIKVDGYDYDYEFNSLTLLVSHWLDSTDLHTIKISDSTVNAVFKRCTNFFTKSLNGLHKKIEISNEAFDLANLIFESKSKIQNVKIILISDAIIKDRPAETEEIEGYKITKVIWDIDRIQQFLLKGEREVINMSFSEDYGEPLPCLKNPVNNGIYTTYLSFISGSTLANMYEKWGTRLLDMNVRVFLSARGNVNRGLRDTIVNQPEMFCAFNNGIAVFAREIETSEIPGQGIVINAAKDFQIINGGQTTASLYHTRKRNRKDISQIAVLMKLTVIHDPDNIPSLVPKISEYSNTQNKVQLADLLANDPPHPELHAISLATLAPDPTGGSKQTYWFYEKSRGSYEESRNLKAHTTAQKKKYDSLYPKKQRFDKNKFGKVWNSYLRLPHLVSLGAQKNFARFNTWLRDQEGENWESFFKKTVALVILWNNTELIVRRQGFEGYRHNIVTYTLAWLFTLTQMRIDLEKIWQKQAISDVILKTVEDLCYIVNQHIRDTEKNVTEWCKKEECWLKLKERSFDLEDEIKADYIKTEKAGNSYKTSTTEEEETISFCSSIDAEQWFTLSKWLKERNYLTGKARSQCYQMGRFLSQKRTPSFALARAAKKAWEDALIRGWGE